MVDLFKYVVAAGVSFIVSVMAWIMGNFMSGILIFILLFGGYILWNVLKGLKEKPAEVETEKVSQPEATPTPTTQDN